MAPRSIAPCPDQIAPPGQAGPSRPRSPRDAAVGLPLIEGEARPDLEEQLDRLNLETEQPPHEPISAQEAAPAGPSSLPGRSAKWKSALGMAINEAKHFAGGLIDHPYEATRQYSVLRHSHGLVFYHGPTTSVAMTIFSGSPLPPDRKLWLQKRGFSGKTGMTIGASLGSRSAWIDVTPSQLVPVERLLEADERAWQRDIKRFIKVYHNSARIPSQFPRETDIIRIPHIADDGYFRIVLCAGTKVLCPSPVFRYISTSTDPGRLRGASLKTLPLELAVKIGSYMAKQASSSAASNALSPITEQLQPYECGGLTQAAAQGIYAASGAEDKVDAQLNETRVQYNERLRAEVDALGGQDPASARLLENEDGPAQPYPVNFTGRVVSSTPSEEKNVSLTYTRLAGVPDNVLLRLSGVYVAWTRVQRPQEIKISPAAAEFYNTWHQSLVTVIPDLDARAKVVERKSVSVCFVHVLGRHLAPKRKLNVMLMALLRPVDHPQNDETSANNDCKIAIAREILSRPCWAAEDALQRTRSQASTRSVPERMASIREAGTKQADRMQLHRLGVKMSTAATRDELIGKGGICVKR